MVDCVRHHLKFYIWKLVALPVMSWVTILVLSLQEPPKGLVLLPLPPLCSLPI